MASVTSSRPRIVFRYPPPAVPVEAPAPPPAPTTLFGAVSAGSAEDDAAKVVLTHGHHHHHTRSVSNQSPIVRSSRNPSNISIAGMPLPPRESSTKPPSIGPPANANPNASSSTSSSRPTSPLVQQPNTPTTQQQQQPSSSSSIVSNAHPGGKPPSPNPPQGSSGVAFAIAGAPAVKPGSSGKSGSGPSPPSTARATSTPSFVTGGGTMHGSSNSNSNSTIMNPSSLRSSGPSIPISSSAAAAAAAVSSSQVADPGASVESDWEEREASGMDFWGFEPLFLATYLTPKRAVSDTPRLIRVDSLGFISHPISLTSAQRHRPWGSFPAQTGKQLVTAQGASSAPPSPVPTRHSLQASSLLRHVAHRLTTGSLGAPSASAQANGSASYTPPNAPSPGSSTPSAPYGGTATPRSYANDEVVEDRGAPFELSTFQVVFVVSGASGADLEALSAASTRLAVALKHEQLRDSYLSDQLRVIHRTRALWWSNRTSSSASVNEVDLVESLSSASSLVRELIDLYDGLKSSGNARLLVNNWVDVSISIRSPPPLLLKSFTTTYHRSPMSQKFDSDTLNSLRPYHTILLLTTSYHLSPATSRDEPTDSGHWIRAARADAEAALLEELPADCSPILRALVASTNPFKSFEALQVEMDVPIMDIYRAAAHLVAWGKGRIIETLSRYHVYVLTPPAPPGGVVPPGFNPAPTITQDLVDVFQNLSTGVSFSLPLVLDYFKEPRPLHDHVAHLNSTQQLEVLYMVIWLLQRGLIHQLHTLVFLAVPRPEMSRLSSIPKPSLLQVPANPSSASATSLSSSSSSSSSPVNGPPQMPAKSPLAPRVPFYGVRELAEWEAEYLSSEQFQKNKPTLALRSLRKLCPYFRGKHSVEEIIRSANVSRSEIASILSQFNDVLVSFLCGD